MVKNALFVHQRFDGALSVSITWTAVQISTRETADSQCESCGCGSLGGSDVVYWDCLGEKIQDWVKSPVQIATFGPRVTLGALLTAPERLSQLCNTLFIL